MNVRKLPPNKKTAEDYHVIAASMNAKWLCTEAVNTHTKTPWQCKICNHIWSTRYSHIQQKHGCPKCGFATTKAKQLYPPAKYHELGEKREFAWLGPEVDGCLLPTNWKCQKAHVFSAAYHDVHQGGMCKVCGIEQGWIKPKKGEKDYLNLAKERQLLWLGPLPKNTGANSSWSCSLGHEFQACFDNIKQGSGCRECGYKRGADKQRLKPQDYERLAKRKKIKWLGPGVSKNSMKTWWQCEQRHNWEAAYNTLLTGNNCPECRKTKSSERQSFKSDKYLKLAQLKNFTWLGPIVKNANQKTGWQCNVCKFEWQQKYGHINSGIGCPYCAAGVGQKELFERVKKLLPGEQVLYDAKPSFLNRQHFDIYIPERAVAIEYHGRQHFEAIKYFGGQDALVLNKQRDERKRKICVENGVRLLEVSSFRQREMSDDDLLDFLLDRKPLIARRSLSRAKKLKL